jgi:hypothetical protein
VEELAVVGGREVGEPVALRLGLAVVVAVVLVGREVGLDEVAVDAFAHFKTFLSH